MIDMEKVISGLQYTIEMFLFDPATGHSKDPDDLNDADRITYNACIGAIALLKEQEPMTPGLKQDAVGIWNTCPRCGHILKSALYDPLTENSMFFHYPNYCEACGQAVKWE